MNSAFVPVGSGMFGFQPSVSLDDFRRLFFIDETSVQQQGAVSHLLTSYRQQNAMVPTSADIDGVYICEGKNDFGTRNQSITIQVEGEKKVNSITEVYKLLDRSLSKCAVDIIYKQ